MNKNILKKLCLVFALSAIFISSSTNAFAWGDRGPHEEMRRGHETYHYRDGRFYRPGWFNWFEFSVVIPPLGAVVTSLPVGRRIIMVGNNRYYYYDDVYYRPAPEGYADWPKYESWRGGLIWTAARDITERKAFAELPVLADMLDEARLCNQPILRHLRQSGPHYVGCWVLRLICELGEVK